MNFLNQSLNNLQYLPIISVRPSEMNAYEELPEIDKGDLIPLILLRPWLGSKSFDNTIERVNKAIDTQHKWIAAIDGHYITPEPSDSERDSIKEFRSLTNPENGYENWCSYLQNIPNCIPCLQTSEIQQISPQLETLRRLGRGLVIKLNVVDNSNSQIIQSIINHSNETDHFIFIFDFNGIATNGVLVDDLNTIINKEIDLFNQITQGISHYRIALSATSFPSDFQNIDNQIIFERELYKRAKETDDNNSWHLLYSDKASVRVATVQRGGGVPYPRIDYPSNNSWHFKRAENNEREEKIRNYHLMAVETVNSDYWDGEINIWGTQLIRETAVNNTSSNMFIQSPAKATAARINIHLHRQLFYNNNQAILETDDDWTD